MSIIQLRQMIRQINLNDPSIFSASASYDYSSEINNDAVLLKRQGKYVESFEVYMSLYKKARRISPIWVRGAFKTLACGGAVMEAYELLSACTMHAMNKGKVDALTIQLLVHQISFTLCVLGFFGLDWCSVYSIEKYLKELSGDPLYKMPYLYQDFAVDDNMRMLSDLSVYSKQVPQLVELAHKSLLS